MRAFFPSLDSRDSLVIGDSPVDIRTICQLGDSAMPRRDPRDRADPLIIP